MKTRTLAIGQASWAQRNPILSFRFVGMFLFRFAERTLTGSLFQEPPRRTKIDRPRMAESGPATFLIFFDYRRKQPDIEFIRLTCQKSELVGGQYRHAWHVQPNSGCDRSAHDLTEALFPPPGDIAGAVS